MNIIFKFFATKTARIFFLSASIIILNCNDLTGQDVTEIPIKALDQGFIELVNTLEGIDKTDDKQSVDLCVSALKNFSDPYIRYYLIFWELSFHYANQKQYDKCLEILKKGQDEGLFYFIRNDEHTFPPYLKELEKLDGYESFLEQNQTLKEAVNKVTQTEYMIQVPDNYHESNEYPLFLVMHGGIGSIPDLQYYYNSPKLKNEFIIAFFQGSDIEGTYSRRFSRDWQERIKKGFEQIILKYPVDAENIILAGPSAGGYGSIVLGMNNIIPSKGLLLSFPVTPGYLDSTAYIQSAERGLKVAQICGENDWAIKQQKELGFKLDKYGINNRFVVFPDKGHEFPDNWPYHLDTSIEFILKEN
ncbi:hypothetical protein ACFLU5_00195 [Bacteroidota bacterium]